MPQAAPLEVTLCHAPHDGIRPAVLLQLGPRGPQYLFSAPEGFSRLVLEHKIRPTAALAAIFCLRPSSLGGLAGILMRLRDDGHGDVLVCGPTGTEQMVKSLRGFVSWRHPQVTVSEVESINDLPAYQDSHMTVYALHGNCLHGDSNAVAQLRQIRQHMDNGLQPPALAPPESQIKQSKTEAGAACNGQQHRSCHANGESSSRGMHADRSQKESRADNSKGKSHPSRHENSCQRVCPSSNGQDMAASGPQKPPSKRVHESSQGASQGEGESGSDSEDESQSESGDESESRDSGKDDSESCRLSRDALKSGNHDVPRGGKQGAAGHPQQAAFERLDAIFSSACSGKASLKSRVGQEIQRSLHSMGGGGSDITQVLGRKAAVSNAAKSPASPNQRSQSEPVHGQSAQPRSNSPLAFLCCLQDRGMLIMALDCPEEADQAALSCHPAAVELALHPQQHVLCLHLTEIPAPLLVQYQAWAESLPGMQVIFDMSPHKPVDGLGHLAAARSLIRLNAISPALFPLPHALAIEAAGADEDIDLPDEDLEHTTNAAAPSQQNEHQRVYTAAGMSHAVVHSALPTSWTKLESFEPLDLGALKEDLLRDHPSLGAALGELKGTTLSRPWYPDSSGSAQCISPPHAMAALQHARHGSQGDTSLRAPSLNAPHAAHRREGSSQGVHDPAAKRQRLAPVPPQLPQPQHSFPAQGDPPIPASLCSSAAAERHGFTAQGGPVPSALPRCGAAAEAHQRAEAVLQHDAGHLLFLGTGCAEPSKYRGSSGIHLRFRHGRGLLIDAGEGVHGQLVRHYGPRVAQQQVDRLCAVWVSHKHADHMLGLPGILSARSADQLPLLVVGPVAAGVWLASMAAFMHLRYQFIHCSQFDRLHCPAKAWLLSTLGLSRWLSVAVEHCRDAWALVLAHMSGWSLVYSGDTRPCKALAAAGRGCTLLIHEATFEPDLISQAVKKRHSTTADALMVAEEMGAYRTVLTHFSSRYPKLPVGLPGNGPALEQVLVAYDGTRLPLSLLKAAPRVMGPLTLAFPKED